MIIKMIIIRKFFRVLIIFVIAYGVLPLILIPLFLLFVCPIYIIRWLTSVCFNFIDHDSAGLIPSRNCILVAEENFEKSPRKNLVVVLRFKGKELLEMGTFRKIVSKCVLKIDPASSSNNDKFLYPQLQQFYVSKMGFLFWKWDRQFNIDNHVKDITSSFKQIDPSINNEKNDDLITEEQLNRFTTPLVYHPFPCKQSPWEFMLVQTCQPVDSQTKTKETTDGKIIDYNITDITTKEEMENPVEPVKPNNTRITDGILVFRSHHGLGDGYSVTNFILDAFECYLDGDSSARRLKLPVSSRNNEGNNEINWFQKIMKVFMFCLVAPYDSVNQVFDGPDSNIWHNSSSKQELSGVLNKVKSGPIPISLIKEIKRNHEVDFNSVVLAVITGAIRRSMEASGTATGTGKGRIIPPYVTCGMPLPVPRKYKRLGNYVSGAFIRLPVGLENPIDRLKAVKSNIQNLKQSTIPLVNLLVLRIVGILPTFMINRITQNNFSTVIATIFGLTSQTILTQAANLEVTDISFGCGFGSGSVGMGMSVISYKGFLRFLTGFDDSILSVQDVSTFVKNIEDEIILLRDQLV